jgi:cell division septum initiation protein DivIVA
MASGRTGECEHGAMAGEIDSLMRDAHTKTEPSFAVAFRGYTRHEVEHYARTVEAQITAILTANGDLEAQVRTLTNQVRMAHDEIGDLRRRPPTADKLAYRHLGARIEQILSDVEEEAATIRKAAIEEAEQERAKLAAALNEARAVFEDEAQRARNERDGARRDLAELRMLHAEQERYMHGRIAATKAELVRAEAAAERQRADAAELLTAAQDAYDRMHASAMANAEAVQADLDLRMRGLRARAYEEASGVVLSAEMYALETVYAAEEYAATVLGTDLNKAEESPIVEEPAIVGVRQASNDDKAHQATEASNASGPAVASAPTKPQRHVGSQQDSGTTAHESQPDQKGSPAAAKVAAGQDRLDENPLVGQ